MPDGAKHGVRLTVKERQALGMALDGKTVDVMATTMALSVHSVQRHLEMGLTKLESWSQDALNGGPMLPQSELHSGVFDKKEGLRQIAQRRRRQPRAWACIVLLYFAKGQPTRIQSPLHAQIIQRIHGATRQTDIIMKWTPKEWVIFLSYVREPNLGAIIRRLQGEDAIPNLRIGFHLGDQNDQIEHGIEVCHNQLMREYIREDLSAVWRMGLMP